MGKKSRRKKETPSRAPAETPREAVLSTPRFATIGVVVLLFLLVFAIYAQVRSHQFIDFDDPQYVANNEQVLRGLTWSGVRWAFTQIHAAYWLPLTWISHMLDVQLFGRNAGAHLLVSVTLHAVNSALLFFFLRAATAAFWRSSIVAALFAVHPLHVESVAWISERKDTLSTLFFLLCLLAYTQYVLKQWRPAYVASVAALALGLMAKPMLVTTPFVLLLLDHWPFRRSGVGKLLIEKIPFFVCVLAASAATLFAQREAMAVPNAIPLLARLANAAIAYVKYVWKTFWPTGLAIIYPFPTRIPPSTAILCAILILASIVAVFRWRRSLPWLFVGWLWFLGTLVPVIGIVQVGLQAMADRFTYIPHIGLFVAVVWTAAHFAKQLPRTATMATAAIIVVLLAAVAHAQVRYWSGSAAVFEHALAVTSNNKLARVNLGAALLQTGDYEGAEREYRQADGFQPAETVFIGLTIALSGQGKLEAAAEAARRAVEASPNSAAAAAMLGAAQLALGNMAEAERALASSLQLREDPAVAARLALARGQWETARDRFVEAIAVNSADADLRNSYAAVLAKLGKDAEAQQQYAEALRLNPNLYDANMNYGALLSRLGRDNGAAQRFTEAARIRPRSPEPHIYLGLLAANQHQIAVATREIEMAMNIDHDASNRLLIHAMRIPPRPTAIDEYLAFLRQPRKISP